MITKEIRAYSNELFTRRNKSPGSWGSGGGRRAGIGAWAVFRRRLAPMRRKRPGGHREMFGNWLSGRQERQTFREAGRLSHCAKITDSVGYSRQRDAHARTGATDS